MPEVARKRSFQLFVAVAVLVLAQVGWWAIIFLRDVDRMAALRTENLNLRAQIGAVVAPGESEEIVREVARHRFMFLSESITFAVLTCFGLYLLFHAFRSEARAQKIQKNFIEMITHESKTPLTALKLRLESIREKGARKELAETDLTLALEEVRRLSSIFEKALHWTRIERHAFHFEVIALSELVEGVVKRLDPFIRARGAKVELNLDRDASVRGDFYGLENSVQSLLENAVLYNEKAEKKVFVKVSKSGHSVLLEVADDGPGIPNAEAEKIFERFYRGRSGKRVPGTGLGLYITKSIIEAHHGLIRLCDKSRFEIFLPEAT